jgi:RHS repeat-associated protein
MAGKWPLRGLDYGSPDPAHSRSLLNAVTSEGSVMRRGRMDRTLVVLLAATLGVGSLVTIRPEPAGPGAGGSAGSAGPGDPRLGWRPASEGGQPAAAPPAASVAAIGVPREDPPPEPAAARSDRRVRELTGRRSATSRVFQLADGRLQQEISAAPVHYRARDGSWQPVDTRVTATGRRGYAYGNETNGFRSFFGTGAGELVLLETDRGAVRVAAPQARTGRPQVDGGTVRYADAFGPGVDLSYDVTAESLKEKIVLAARPAAPGDVSFRFELRTSGLQATARGDGSIAFGAGGHAPPALVMPKPFMVDSAGDASSPYGTAFSDAVTQSLSRDGSRLLVTVTADGRWLADPQRRYPVVIDPTIKIAPTPTDSQDTMILSDTPATNYDDSWRLSAGTTETGAARSLLKFPLDGIPAGTPIGSAQLQLYYDQHHTVDPQGVRAVTLEARRATADWTETTATWNTASGNLGELSATTEDVDDGDPLQTGASGIWPAATAADRSHAVGSGYLFNKNAATGETYTWSPVIPEAGTYRVEAHFVSGPDRATAAPYTVNHQSGSATVAVDQSAASAGGGWRSLGSYPFVPGGTANVVLGDVADSSKAVVADAVRVVKDATAVRPAGDKGSHWHRFSVRDTVQGWVDGTVDNYGFVVKAADESTLNMGGPRYEGSIYAYQGETATYPRLVVTYGRPGVAVNPIRTIHATGAELSWPAYADPCAWCGPADDLDEYQVHRSVRQTFTPSAATLVAPVAAGTLTYVDSTAEPTPAGDADPFGNAYYYLVAVKTKDGELVAGPTQLARLPKAGRTTKVFQDGVLDTTLSSTQPDANLDRLDGQAWLSVGNNSASYGRTRAAVKFPVSGIPAAARVLDAEVKLWTAGTVGDAGAAWEMYGLGRDFAETQATWNRATAATAWTAAGGDVATPVAGSATTFTNDPRRRNFAATALAQQWVSTPSSNRGVLFRLADETTPASRAVFLSSEADEPELGPQLVVTYLETTTESTYHVPDTPPAVAPESTTTLAATVTNTTRQALARADWVLSYRWTRPDGTAVTAEQVPTPLPADLPSGATVTVQAQVKAPPAPAEGNRRTEHVLSFDLLNKTTGRWLSGGGAVDTVGALKQSLAVEDASSDQLGLEGFYAYRGVQTGSGSALMNNLHAGNAVWSYNAFSNPSRGLATFVRLAYNSKDTSDSAAGFGWSVQASSIARLGTPIDPHPNTHARTVALTDGDGTTHTFTLDDRGTPSTADDEYRHPAGVHLFLQRLVDCKPKDEVSRAWVMTRPDRTQFFFDCAGYLSSTVDNNGNQLDFVYESRKSNNQPTKFLRHLVDPAGRRTLTIDYYAKGDAYDYVDDATWTRRSATNLTNPFIIDHVRQITDLSGRRLTFAYTDKGLLGELVDGAGSGQPKLFKFAYDMTQGNKNVKLVKVTDPRGGATGVAYYSPPADDPKFHWSTRTVTDRLGGALRYAYTDPDGSAGQDLRTAVTDPENRVSTYLMDGEGRPTQTTNAKNQTIKLAWDADNNVVRLEEPNAAVSTWTYDARTGYPTGMRDAEANHNGWAGTTMTYQAGLGGNTADLTGLRSPEGRLWTFTYTAEGDLASVTDPIGNTTATAGDYTTSYTYDTWGQMLTVRDANGRTTRYGQHHASGYPTVITDPLTRATTFGYDVRGNVTQVTDALGKQTSQAYDHFGRPLEGRVPRNQAAGDFVVTPAPQYDANDNLTRSAAPNGAVTQAEYDPADRLVHRLDPKDDPAGPERRTSYTFDKVGNLRTVTEPNGTLSAAAGDFVTTYAYDETYQLTSVTNAVGDRLGYVYDSAGNVSKVIDPRKSATADPEDYTTWFWYDLNHRVRVELDALVKTKVTEYDRDGLARAVYDQAGNKTDIVTDPRGKPVEIRVPQVDNGGTSTHRTTRFSYDQVGNRTKVTTPRGVATAGVATDFVHETVYDELNRVAEQLTPFDPADARYNRPDRTTYSYDEVGRLRTVSAPPSSGETTRNDTTYTYTDNGWVTSSTDPWGIETIYAHNELGQQIARIVAAAGRSTSRWMVWDYFPDGKTKSRTDIGVPVGNRVVLVDNTDFNNVRTTGTWTASTTATGHHGRNYLTHPAAAGTDTVEWGLNIPQDGSYEVAVWYPGVPAATSAAAYRVTHAGGTTEKTVDQRANAGTWVSLGRFTFRAGAAAKVALAQGAGGVAVADAVRLVRDNAGEADNESKDYAYAYDPNGNLTAVTDRSPGRRIDSYQVLYTGLNQVREVREVSAGVLRNTTAFTYDANGAPETTRHDKTFSRYGYDVRNLVSTVTNGVTPTDPAPKVTTYTYTDRREPLRQVKGNGNTVDFTYFLDGTLRTQVEKKADGTLVSDHAVTYDLNGNRTRDAVRKMSADDNSAYLDTTSTYTYDPRDRVATVVGTGAGAGTETYLHDANNNVISATVGNVTTNYNYDRDRLLTAVTGGVTASYNYDPFGRLDTVTSGGQVRERKVYDGFDRVVEHVSSAGGATTTTRYGYDPLDRTASKTANAGTAGEKTTTFNYLGLSGEVLDEEVAGQVARSYQYSPWGERLSQVTTTDSGGKEDAYYGYNAHTDVETLTGSAGATTATYGYTAYGRDDEDQFTGIDKPDAADPAKEPYNPYRFNAKRWDAGSGEYDMGFRDYSPGLNRFLTRDMYNGALADLNLTTSPFTGNRYAFGAGNPVTNVELDGHIPDDCVRGSIRCTADAEGRWTVTEREACREWACARARDEESMDSQRRGAQPEVSQDILDQVMAEAERLLDDGDAFGLCGELDASLLAWGVSGQGCMVKAGDDYGVTFSESGNWGWYGTDANVMGTLQTMYSTAENLDDLRGPTVCVSGGAGAGPAISGAVCAGFADADYDEVTSVSVVVGAGYGHGVDAPASGSPSGGLQFGYTGARELPAVEAAVEGLVNTVDERTGWSAFWEAVPNPRAWM